MSRSDARAPARTPRRARSSCVRRAGGAPPARSLSAMRGRLLVRDSLDWTFVGSDGRPGDRLDHRPRALGVGDPLFVEVVRAGGYPARVFARVDLARVAPMDELEQVVLRLHVPARIADQSLRQLRVLDTVVLLAALAERAPVEADDRRVPEVRVDAVEAGCI